MINMKKDFKTTIFTRYFEIFFHIYHKFSSLITKTIQIKYLITIFYNKNYESLFLKSLYPNSLITFNLSFCFKTMLGKFMPLKVLFLTIE